MALIKCKSCGKEISDKSTKCVHCGCDTDYSITYFCSGVNLSIAFFSFS